MPPPAQPSGPQQPPSYGSPGTMPPPGQMPPQGPPPQDYGQPGAHQPTPGQAPPHGYGPPPGATAAKKGRGVGGLIKGAIALVVLGVGGYFALSNLLSSAEVKEGNCLVFSGTADDANHKLVDCDDADTASHRVVSVHSGSGNCGDASSYTLSGGRGPDKIGCLVPNFKENVCYTETGDVNEFEVSDCGSADFKISKVSMTEEVQCGETEFPFAMPEHSTWFCLAEPA